MFSNWILQGIKCLSDLSNSLVDTKKAITGIHSSRLPYLQVLYAYTALTHSSVLMLGSQKSKRLPNLQQIDFTCITVNKMCFG